jgi:hypothetical protein
MGTWTAAYYDSEQQVSSFSNMLKLIPFVTYCSLQARLFVDQWGKSATIKVLTSQRVTFLQSSGLILTPKSVIQRKQTSLPAKADSLTQDTMQDTLVGSTLPWSPLTWSSARLRIISQNNTSL